MSVESTSAAHAGVEATESSAGVAHGPWDDDPVVGRFVLDPDRSAVLIDARSTVGPISFGDHRRRGLSVSRPWSTAP